MNSFYIKSGDLNLYSEAFGDKDNSAILLIMGAGVSSVLWPDYFCELLAKNNFFVIRYDNRDSGRSSSIDFKQNPYNLDDLAKDAINVLNFYRISKAHIIGLSMGGFIAQILAINNPERVLSLISLSSTCDHSPLFVNKENKYNLPGSKIKLLNIRKEVKYSKDLINTVVNIWQSYSESKDFFDYNFTKDLAIKFINSTRDFSGSGNHGKAIEISDNRTEKLKNSFLPALVIHGQNDPILPVEHGIFTAKNISNSKLEIVQGMGHLIMSEELCDKLGEIVIKFIAPI